MPKPDEAAAALIGTTQKLPRIRQSIAKNMKFGLDTAAQLTTVMEVDVTRVAALRARAKSGFAAREGVNLSFLPFFVKAALEAAKAYPVINSTLSDDLKEITYHGSVNLGIAVDTPRGLIVPVIKGADDLNIAGIARKIADLAKRTRDNKIGPDELSGGTFTVTNTGSVGALFDTPIFVPPQSAILGTGAIVKRPMVIKDADGNEVIAHPLDVLPRAVLRPPQHRRRRRVPVPRMRSRSGSRPASSRATWASSGPDHRGRYRRTGRAG